LKGGSWVALYFWFEEERMKTILAAIFLLAVASGVGAQTQYPVIAEFQAKADENVTTDGQVTVRNDGLFPLVTTVEAMSFSVSSDGSQTFSPLSPDISLHFDNSSAKIPAKSEHVFYYRATCAKAPCFFVIYSSMTGPRARNVSDQSIAVALHLPTVFYCYQKTPVAKGDIGVSWDGNDLRVANNSSGMVRAASVEAHFADGKVQKSGAFPMFPSALAGHERTFKYSERPAFVIVKFPKFSIDTREIQ
jgi:hypothetical protein